MTRGWARAAHAPWSEAHFDLDATSLGIHRIDHVQPHLRIGLDRIRRVDELERHADGTVDVEIVTTTGAVVAARWPAAFGEQVVGALLTTLDRPPAPLPVPRHLSLADGEFSGLRTVDAPDLSDASRSSLMAALPRASQGRADHRGRRGHGRHRSVRWALGAALIVVGLVGADLIALHNRIERFDTELPVADDGARTWLLVGSDSRAAATGLPLPETYGSTSETPGERADVVLVVREGVGDEPARILSVPRDLLVFRRGHGVDRLALTLLDGPTGLVTSICRSLGLPVDHVVRVRFDGLRDLVDAVDGIEVDADHPTRDLNTGLDLEVGTNHLDGAGAIAWMRSRHIERLVDGTWQADTASDTGRQQNQRQVLDQLASRLASKARNPVTLQQLAWTVTGAVGTDGDTGPVDLVRLARTLRGASESESLPHSLVDGSIPVATLEPDAQELLDDLRSELPDGPPCPRPEITS